MSSYTGTIIVNVSAWIEANSDAKAQERLDLVAKRIDETKALERAGEWVRSVDFEDVSVQSDDA